LSYVFAVADDKKIVLDGFSMSREQSADAEYTTVGITVEARDGLTAYCRQRHGANVREVISSLVMWFLKMPPPGRTAILEAVDEGMRPAYAKALRQLAEELEAVKPVDTLVVDTYGGELPPPKHPPKKSTRQRGQGGKPANQGQH
jgi:hypothetical protein